MATSLSLLKPELKTAIAESLFNEIGSGTNSYYYFLGKPLEWTGGDATVTTPDNTLVAERDTRKEIVFLKKITPADIAFTVPRHDWVAGQVYDMYDDRIGARYNTSASAPSANFSFVEGSFDLSLFGQGWLVTGEGIDTGTFVDEATPTQIKLTKRTVGAVTAIAVSKLATSGATALETSNFYVLTNDRNVYKCLDNNNGAQSTSKPYSTTHETIRTSDGYVWKYMYTIPNSLINKFVSLDDLPVTTSVKSAYYSRGALSSFQILNSGSGYQPGDQIVVTGNGHQQNNTYRLIAVTVEDSGSGYVTEPEVTITPPYEADVFESTTQYLTGQYVQVDNRVYRVDAGGTSGSTAPTHTSVDSVANGSTTMSFAGIVAQGTTVLEDDGVQSVLLDGVIGSIGINNVGKGYDYLNPPTVTIVGDGLGATATAVVSAQGYVAQIILTDRGSGYTSAVATIEPPLANSVVFNGSSTGVISVINNTLTLVSHEFATGDRVVYSKGITANTAIGGLTSGNTYYVIVDDEDTIRLALSLSQAMSADAIDITSVGTGTGHVIEDDAETAIATAEIYYGYGYNTVPSISVEDPFTADSQWAAGDSVAEGDIIQVGTRFYEVTSAGSSQVLGVQVPTHTEGEVTISGVDLTFIGQTAVLSMFTERTRASLAPIIEGGQVIGVTVQDPGVGYTVADVNVISSGSGSGAVIEANLSVGDLNTRQANTELLSVPGTIDAIDVLHPGLGYAVATITVDGDGQGCEAVAVIQGGAIVKINVTSPGFGYTFASVIITGNPSATQAYAQAIVSPVSGHGKDAIKELFAKDISLASSIALDKNQGFIVENDYRQLGVIKNPTTFNSTQRWTRPTGSTCYSITGNFVYSQVEVDSVMTDAGGNRYQVVAVPESDPGDSVPVLVQSIDNAIPVIGGSISYDDTVATISQIVYPTVDKYSGEMLFVDNRTAFQPTPEQTVSLKTVIRL